jgi:hypothetical protein
MSKVKVTKLPPAPQDVFFQEQQFDDSLSGTDPNFYMRAGFKDFRKASHRQPPAYGNSVKKGRLKQAEKVLDGHENKDEILKILRSE